MMDFLTLLQRLAEDLEARQIVPSALLPPDDDPGRPTRPLIDLALEAARCASDVDLSQLSNRLRRPPFLPDVWPGEHYRLLSAFMQVIRPALVIEIGTATGMSALAIKHGLPQSSRVVTFDLVRWENYPDHVLYAADFADGRLQQIIGNLTDLQVARQYAALLNEADFFFIDAAKDGMMESMLLDNFASVGIKEGAWLLFDDIRLVPMVPT